MKQLNAVIVSSVRAADEELLGVLQQQFDQFMELDHTTALPIENLYATPESLGKGQACRRRWCQ